MARQNNSQPQRASAGVEELTPDQVHELMVALAAELGVSLDEALRRLDRGEYDDLIVSSKLRMLRFLEEESDFRRAAE